MTKILNMDITLFQEGSITNMFHIKLIQITRTTSFFRFPLVEAQFWYMKIYFLFEKVFWSC